LGWKESKIGRKRRKKVEFDLTLLAGKAKRGGIGLTPARAKSKKQRGDRAMRSHNTERAIRSHGTDITDIVLVGGKEAKKLVKQFDSHSTLAHEKQMKKHLDLAHPILLMCQNCGLEGLQSEWVKRGESKQSKPKLTCPRCGSSEHRVTE
jgi:Zn finger protein HypA/HybF involved in hydrogenase expression